MLLMLGGVSGWRGRRVGGPVSLTSGGQPASNSYDLTDAEAALYEYLTIPRQPAPGNPSVHRVATRPPAIRQGATVCHGMRRGGR